MNDGPTVLVVGAAHGSLGEAISMELKSSDWLFGMVATAGITTEHYRMDLLRRNVVAEVLAEVKPDIVICTVGVNLPVDITDPFLGSKLASSFENNVTGPMDLLRLFTKSPTRLNRADLVKKFVAISSNSARVARRNSIGYCASKAALSMALRVAARELAPARSVMVWGYEPGMLDGTPMTREVFSELGPKNTAGMHRMPGVPPEGIPPQDLAKRIVQDVATFSYAYSGTLIPFDAGEQ